ncbi:DUF4893 domain-containing protein [Sphingomonas sinipercae]|uniref:DUF4893 domain-containing protein n=1 Tax=Sphingomonas sinipercae TaxID=2714944 RepID=A0A6G7ZLY6_9SPHN|nr:DUF4893 domain-containing protein [Sphingomonas sinipercae]QIL01928.1 DUF4893 domain-containing protein [Sphingomonas sinipercae]
MKFSSFAATAGLALALVLGGCTSSTLKQRRAGASVTVEPERPSDVWKAVATAPDQSRIQRLGLAWQDALIQVKARHARDVAAEGILLKPIAAEPRPQPTPGSYNCRLIKLGRAAKKGPLFEKFKPFFCYVLADDQGTLTIVKQTGSQRPSGQLWDDDGGKRMIFLGSLAIDDEKEPLAYGEDPTRDTAGVFERIAPMRWRLVIPYPRSGAKLEVFELTPVPNQPE